MRFPTVWCKVVSIKRKDIPSAWLLEDRLNSTGVLRGKAGSGM